MNDETMTQKNIIEAHLPSDAIFKATIDATTDGILVIDKIGRILSSNVPFQTMWRIPEELVEENDSPKILKFVMDQLENPEEFLRKAKQLYLGDEESFDTLLFKDGRVFERYSKPLMLGEQVSGRVWSFRNISNRLLLEKELNESHQMVSTILNCTTDQIFLMDPEGQVYFGNVSANREYDLDSDVLSKEPVPFESFWQGDSKFKVERAIRSVKNEKCPIVVDCERDQRYFEMNFTPEIQAGELRSIICVAREISDRVSSDRAVQNAHSELSQVYNSGLPLCVVDKKRRVVRTNAPYHQIMDKRADKIIGQSCYEVWPGPNCHTDKCAIQQILEGAQEVRFEKTLVNQDGDERTYLILSKPFRDVQQNVIGMVQDFLDVTEQHRAVEERGRLEEQLRQSQKLEAIGRLAGGVAHDFNNILTGIRGFSEMILSQIKADDPIYEDANEIQNAAERAAGLTQQLLAFSRKQIIEPKIFSPNEVIDKSQKMISRIIGEDIELKFFQGVDLWNIEIDPAQLDQILVNLATNGRDAMPSGGKLTIETQNTYLDSDSKVVGQDQIGTPYVMLAVSDNGDGMDEETQKQIFEPFFSTKEKNRGTGLGLATVYGVVQQNHGIIKVYSERKFGTSFKIYFPQVDAPASSKTVPQPESHPMGTETILLVEDEEMVRKLSKKILERQGYLVLDAASAPDAFILFRNHIGQIQMLLTDVIMPKMNGKELYEKLRLMKPELKVLFMSGYTENVIAQHGVLEEGMNFIQKPFTLQSLIGKVGQVLETQA